MTNSQLKTLAILAMTADHIGAVFFPQVPLLRVIGRLTMPIMCFLLTEGFRHTRSVKRYAGRLAVFALLSELPFDLAFFGGVFFGLQNIFFTLLSGLLALNALSSRRPTAFYEAIAWGGVAALLRADYGFYGVLLILLFFYLGQRHVALPLCMFLLTLFFFGPSIQLFSLLALLPISFYNGQRGRELGRLFYLYYPLHLLILSAAYTLAIF